MASIQIRDEIPGPRSHALMARRVQAVPRGVFHSTPIFAARAEGALVEDVDGNTFIDLAGGIGCVNTGHRAEPVLAAIRDQIDRYLHTGFSVSPYEGYVELAERLNQLTPGKFAKKTLILNTGSEAVENAVKIARAYTKRPAAGPRLFPLMFHGRTLLALSLTSKTHPYKAGFQPFVSDVYRYPTGATSIGALLSRPTVNVTSNRYSSGSWRRRAWLPSSPNPCWAKADSLHHLRSISARWPRSVANMASRSSLMKCRPESAVPVRCSRASNMGSSRTCCLSAKSLGGGLPISAITGRAEIMDSTEVGGLGGTFIGNPVSCAAALAVLDMVEREKLSERAQKLGDRFMERATRWKNQYPVIGQIHGIGAMRALELVRDRESREPASDETKAIVRYCYEHGVLTISAGTFSNIIRLLMPLVITDEQFEEALSVLESALESVSGAPVAAGANRSSYA